MYPLPLVGITSLTVLAPIVATRAAGMTDMHIIAVGVHTCMYVCVYVCMYVCM